MIEVSGLLCTGDDSLFKINWQLTIIQLSSFVIHGLTNIKIKLFEMSQQKSKHLRTHFEEDISFIDGRAISDFATNVFAVVATSSFGISTTIVNYLNPADFNRYPDYFLVYFLNFRNHLDDVLRPALSVEENSLQRSKVAVSVSMVKLNFAIISFKKETFFQGNGYFNLIDLIYQTNEYFRRFHCTLTKETQNFQRNLKIICPNLHKFLKEFN
jgi:hypothetical protein